MVREVFKPLNLKDNAAGVHRSSAKVDARMTGGGANAG
jgi:hypothetical protein